MPLIGTAGHVDHGKSTLIEAITGRDPDRWAEEKRRGLTIDLGFAWATLPGGTEVSFVDVPGHERFLKNMLAGIEAIDVALFVVAADEGWMPQSEEHLAVVDLLEVDRGVVAVTKVDLVDEEMIELATAEVADHLARTTLDGARIVPVSARSGQGLPQLLEALAELTPTESPDRARPRLWVDRSFTITGAGTVVTGTLLGGSLAVDDAVEAYPKGLQGRVRGIQSHETTHDSVGPGRRVALNLGGIDYEDLERGDLIAAPGQWETSGRFTVSLRKARYAEKVEPRGAYQLHLGSSAHRVEITGLHDQVAMLQVDTALPMAVGDRFILRDTGRKLVVAGGRVLDPAPGTTKLALGESTIIDPELPPDEIASVLLAIRGTDLRQRLAAHSDGGRVSDAVEVGDRVVAPRLIEELVVTAVSLVDAEHSRHPLRPGLPLATLAERLGVDLAMAEKVVDHADTLERRGPDVALAGHTSGLDPAQQEDWARVVETLHRSLAVPSESDLGLDAEVVHLKLRAGELVRVGPSLLFLPDQIEELKRLIRGLPDEFTVAEFRDAAGLSRKYAVPILEWADREGLTVRRGDLRGLR